METRVRPVDPHSPHPTIIAEAAALIRAGDLVAFPTETVYGLGANALDPIAVAKIYDAKERPTDNPLIVHISDPAAATTYATISPSAQVLIDAFWPGPLSLVLHKKDTIPAATTAGLDTVVLRCPEHPVARALITAADVPMSAPSANRSGRPSPTRAEHVQSDLAGRIQLILDGGAVEYGLESTVIDCTGRTPTILRSGSITREQLAEHVELAEPSVETASSAPRSPGLRHRHYAPTTPLILALDASAMHRFLAGEPHPERCAVIHHSPLAAHAGVTRRLPADPELAAPLLFDAIRTLDAERPTQLLIEGYPETGVGQAVMDRLRRGASAILS